MRMARVNVYLPDELAAQAKEAGLNVSGLTREAIQSALTARRVDDWLDGVGALSALDIDEHVIAAAVSAAKDEFASRA
jgi:post-segregation antitoxin (ccd killing protein)